MGDQEDQARFGDTLDLPTGVHDRVVARRPRFDLRVLDWLGEPAPDIFAALDVREAIAFALDIDRQHGP